jgi:hypothetical protein
MALIVRDAEGVRISGIEALIVTTDKTLVKYSDPSRGQGGMDEFLFSHGDIMVTNEIEEC